MQIPRAALRYGVVKTTQPSNLAVLRRHILCLSLFHSECAKAQTVTFSRAVELSASLSYMKVIKRCGG